MYVHACARGRTGRELRAQLVGADRACEQPVHDLPGLAGRVGRPGDPDHVRLDGPPGGQPLPGPRPDRRPGGADAGDVDDARSSSTPASHGARTARQRGAGRPPAPRVFRPTRARVQTTLAPPPHPEYHRLRLGKSEPSIPGGSRIPTQGRDTYATPIHGRAARARSIGPAGACGPHGRSGRLRRPHARGKRHRRHYRCAMDTGRASRREDHRRPPAGRQPGHGRRGRRRARAQHGREVRDQGRSEGQAGRDRRPDPGARRPGARRLPGRLQRRQGADRPLEARQPEGAQGRHGRPGPLSGSCRTTSRASS